MFAVLIPVVHLDDGPALLMEVRSDHVPQPGEVCFPGGKIEEGETAREAAVRETGEELGVLPEDISFLEELQPETMSDERVIFPVLARVSVGALQNLRISEEEVAGTFFLPLRWLMAHPPEEYSLADFRAADLPEKLRNYLSHYNSQKASGGSTWYWEYQDHGIWGLTARILRRLLTERAPEKYHMQRTIFHIDVNSAFLSWSALKQLEEDPGSIDLRTIPSAVGGDVETRHGVITAKSIPAKAYKIQTGEPVVKALAKCPDLVLVRSDFVTYRKYSHLFIDILKEYTDKIQQVSIDEAYMDATDLVRSRDDALRLADNIKNSIYGRLGFTVNVGISENKFLAKMASDFEKPDKVHTLYLQEIRQKMWPLPVREMYGCGKATADKLNELGFQTIGDVAQSQESLLKSILGEKAGEYVHARANGLDDSPVEVERQEAKSYSNETTTIVDVTADNYEKEGLPLLFSLSSKVSGRLKKHQVFGSTISVMVKTGSFQRYSRQTSLYQSTNDEKVIRSSAEQLMKELLFGEEGLFKKGEVLRLIGVGVSSLDNGDFHQMDLSEWMGSYKERQEQHEKKEKLDIMMKKIQEKYGKGALKRGDKEE